MFPSLSINVDLFLLTCTCASNYFFKCHHYSRQKMSNVLSMKYCSPWLLIKKWFQRLLRSNFPSISEIILFPKKLQTRKVSNIIQILNTTLRKRFLFPDFFWFLFSLILAEYGDLLRQTTYSVRLQEYVDQKNSKYKSFPRSAS